MFPNALYSKYYNKDKLNKYILKNQNNFCSFTWWCTIWWLGDSVIRKGAGDGGGESTSNSGDTEHDLDANRDWDELLDRDFVLLSLKLDEKFDKGDIFSWYVLLLSSSSDSWLFLTNRLILKLSCSEKNKK